MGPFRHPPRLQAPHGPGGEQPRGAGARAGARENQRPHRSLLSCCGEQKENRVCPGAEGDGLACGPPRDPITPPGNQSTCIKRNQQDKERQSWQRWSRSTQGAPGRCLPKGGDPLEDKARQTRNTSSRWPDGLAQLQRPLGKLVQAKGKRDTPTGSALGEGRADHRQSPRTPADTPRGPRGGGAGRGGVDVATEREAGAPSRHPIGAGRGHQAPSLAVFSGAAAPSAGQGGAGEEGPASPVPGREEASLSSDCAAPRKGALVFQPYFQKRLEAAAEAPSKQEGGKRSGSCDFEWEPGGRGARVGAQSHRRAGLGAEQSSASHLLTLSSTWGHSGERRRHGGRNRELPCVCVCVRELVCVCVHTCVHVRVDHGRGSVPFVSSSLLLSSTPLSHELLT